jgi:AraC-like DNA-binding protein
MPDARSSRVLLVDDDPAVCEALAAALAPDYACQAAASGAEATRLLTLHDVSAIILDVFLGEECGLDLVPALRAVSAAPILLLTGRSSEEVAIRAVEAGVAGYLKKPVDVPALRAALARCNGGAHRPEDVAARVRRYLDAQAGRVDFEEMAARFGLGEPHLRRLFREAYGSTPQRYLRERRLREAARLLQERGQRVEQAALRVGYASGSVFGKHFRRLFGVAPAEYRRGIRARPPIAPGPSGTP